jgi:cytochrome oxidase assembly protein ShyY1
LYLDPAEIAEDAGQAIDERVLLLDPAADSGFVRDWKPQGFPPARHYGYALTWFTFLPVALAIFAGLHWRKVDSAGAGERNR